MVGSCHCNYSTIIISVPLATFESVSPPAGEVERSVVEVACDRSSTRCGGGEESEVEKWMDVGIGIAIGIEARRLG